MKKYDTKFMKTDEARLLYTKWHTIKRGDCCKEWLDFMAFCEWAFDNDFECGAVLKRYHKSEPYSPRNCYFVFSENTNPSYNASEFCALWNKTVNRIRVHYGLEPLGVDENGARVSN